MSTRSAVARWNGGKWEGVYVHSDGYPTWRGRELWALLHGPAGGDVDKLLTFLIDEHPNGWSSLGEELVAETWDFPNRGKGCIYYDRDDDGPMPQSWDGGNALFIEWVYAFDAHTRQLHVLCGRRAAGTHTETGGGGRTWESPNYEHAEVTILDLDGPEPDWQAVEDHGHGISTAAYEEHAPEALRE
jgi:hypothetical protein